MKDFNLAIEKICSMRDFSTWSPGDKEAFVFNDGVVIISLDETGSLDVSVLAGECEHIDMNLNL